MRNIMYRLGLVAVLTLILVALDYAQCGVSERKVSTLSLMRPALPADAGAFGIMDDIWEVYPDDLVNLREIINEWH